MPKSPFPEHFARVWLNYSNTWNSNNDIWDQSGVSIHHGASSEGGEADVSTMAFALSNPAGHYNPRNPNSPYYGLIGQNTKARATCALGAPWLQSAAFAADAPELSITGDIDLRWWGHMPTWESAGNLISKWSTTPGQASFIFESVGNGILRVWWSNNGTAYTYAETVVPVPAWAGPVALRVALDVNNGIGGSTASFYFSSDLDGEWMPLGAPVQVVTTIQSIFDSPSQLMIRDGSNTTEGRVYGWEIRTGINGAIVSSGHSDRWIIGWNKNALLRSNLFYDPFPGGPVADWYTSGTTGVAGVIQDPVHGKIIESRKNSASASATPFNSKSMNLTASTQYKMAFDMKFEGSGSTSNVIFYWRPNGSTGQVVVTQNIQNLTEWTHIEVTFTTSATAPNVNAAAFAPVIPAAYAIGSRVLMKNVSLATSSATDLSVFSGDNTNSTSRFYFWTAAKYGSPSVEYSATTSSTIFSDDQGRNWTTNAGSSLTNRHTLMVGEVAEWPMEWGKKGAKSVITNIDVGGVSRRLGQGEQPVNSPLFNSIMGIGSALQAYWPMEGENAGGQRLIGQAVGGYPAWYSGTPGFGAYDGFDGSFPILNIGVGTAIECRVHKGTNTGKVQVRHLLHLPADGIGAARILETLQFFGIGSNLDVSTVEVWVDDAGALRLIGYNSAENPVAVFDSGYVAFNANDRDVRFSIELNQVGANLEAKMVMIEENLDAVQWAFTALNRPMGPLRSVTVNPNSSVLFGETGYGHLTVENAITSIYSIPSSVIGAYPGESTVARLRRISDEKGIEIRVAGPGSSAGLGAQPREAWLAIARNAAAADGGILHDDTGQLGLKYRTLDSLYDQPAVTIPYQDNLIRPFVPVDDDAMLKNRVTRSRPGGSPFTAEATTGRLSTQDPPNGAGVYEDSRDVNVATDDLAERTAGWDKHIGTWDEGRYPTIGVDLADAPFMDDPVLTRQLLSLSVGDRLQITDLPSWLPPFPADVLVMGIQYDIDPHHVRLTWTCVPARPYRAAYYNAGHRYSAEGTVLSGALTTTATTVPLTVPAGLSWTHADGDYDIVVGGELMTVKSVVGTTMTVVRSVNGVVKTHAIGATVSLADPSFYAR